MCDVGALSCEFATRNLELKALNVKTEKKEKKNQRKGPSNNLLATL